MTGVHRPAVIVAAALLLVVSLILVLNSPSGPAGASHMGGMDAMSIDMDTAGNTATSLGPRESCGEVSPGGTKTFDVTALNVPSSTALIAYSFTLAYDEAPLTLTSHNFHFLLASDPGSAPATVSEFIPDTNGNNRWSAAVADLASADVSPPESGSGVLSRLTISANAAAPAGFYNIHIFDGFHITSLQEAFSPDTHESALLAVGVSCAGAPLITPTPIPSPAPPSSPSPTPPPNPIPPDQGMQRMSIDMNVAGNDATTVGLRNPCAEAGPGDQVTLDITTTGIPAPSLNGTPGNPLDDYGGMIAFKAIILYPEDAFTVVFQDFNFLLAVSPSSTVANGSEPLPDVDGNDEWISNNADTSSPPSIPESGNGVLTRVRLAVDAGAPAGLHSISLRTDSAHLDSQNAAQFPKTIDNAYIAVGVPCDVDFDGVADDEDGCPNYFGLVDNAGCPPAGAPAVGGITGLLDEPRPVPSDQADAASTRLAYLGLAALVAASGAALLWWGLQPRRRD